MRWRAIAALALLVSGCGLFPSGRQLQFTGEVCGQQVDMLYNDRTDQAEPSSVKADCGDGTGVTWIMGASQTSPVGQVDAALLLELIRELRPVLVAPVP